MVMGNIWYQSISLESHEVTYGDGEELAIDLVCTALQSSVRISSIIQYSSIFIYILYLYIIQYSSIIQYNIIQG